MCVQESCNIVIKFNISSNNLIITLFFGLQSWLLFFCGRFQRILWTLDCYSSLLLLFNLTPQPWKCIVDTLTFVKTVLRQTQPTKIETNDIVSTAKRSNFKKEPMKKYCFITQNTVCIYY